ncbi:hypothetical protein E2C01_013236 [Portunus trituberculatus]|uniref:Uncharacterized protein n=1 Tax=Portunus trituberculatus TaxID=210409 RepID=A0A5B7DGJ9_PORTR|nr:hypothetical protein [Portunus trituberculatus]
MVVVVVVIVVVGIGDGALDRLITWKQTFKSCSDMPIDEKTKTNKNVKLKAGSNAYESKNILLLKTDRKSGPDRQEESYLSCADH